MSTSPIRSWRAGRCKISKFPSIRSTHTFSLGVITRTRKEGTDSGWSNLSNLNFGDILLLHKITGDIIRAETTEEHQGHGNVGNE